MLAKITDAVGNPVDVLFYDYRHIGEYRWAARFGDREQVGETGNLQTEISAWFCCSGIAQGSPAATADIHIQEGAGHRVKTGGEDDRIQFIVLLFGA